MARLIDIQEFNISEDSKGFLNPLWYFSDARWEYRARRVCKFTIESGYPIAVAIHQDRFDDNSCGYNANRFRIEIRRWIEGNLSSDVILKQVNMEYRLWYRETTKYNYYSEYFEDIKHGYYVFHFETEAEAMMFRLKFSEYIDEIQPTHPRESWRTEENGWYTTLYDRK